MTDVGIINIDDSYGKQLSLLAGCRTVTCSLENPNADFYADSIECTPQGCLSISPAAILPAV